VDHKKDYKPPEDKEVNNEEGEYERFIVLNLLMS
jgi:hypothetical protein